MRYLLITLLFIYAYSTATSQNLSLLNYQTNAFKNVIGIKTDFAVGSGDVSWGFTKKLIQGKLSKIMRGEVDCILENRAVIILVLKILIGALGLIILSMQMQYFLKIILVCCFLEIKNMKIKLPN